MAEKDFDGWNEQKKSIHAADYLPFYKERDVRWCRLGTNVGVEQGAHALISQMRLVDTKRLDSKIAALERVVFECIRKAAKDML